MRAKYLTLGGLCLASALLLTLVVWPQRSRVPARAAALVTPIVLDEPVILQYK